eukprot:scaffold19830_cov66-Skeletonema_marinoi.AAC.1
MDGDHDVEMTTTTTAPANKPNTPCPIYLYTGRGPPRQLCTWVISYPSSLRHGYKRHSNVLWSFK